MVLNTTNIINQGAFADIFVYENRAIKLFISTKNKRCSNRERGENEDKLRKITFDSELKAWEIATENKELREFIPEYFGKVEVEKVFEESNSDCTSDYLIDCCYSIEKIEGTAVKFAHIREQHLYVEKKLHENGIAYTEDMDVFVINDGSKLKLIDFSTEDAYNKTELLWIASGKI